MKWFKFFAGLFFFVVMYAMIIFIHMSYKDCIPFEVTAAVSLPATALLFFSAIGWIRVCEEYDYP